MVINGQTIKNRLIYFGKFREISGFIGINKN